MLSTSFINVQNLRKEGDQFKARNSPLPDSMNCPRPTLGILIPMLLVLTWLIENDAKALKDE